MGDIKGTFVTVDPPGKLVNIKLRSRPTKGTANWNAWVSKITALIPRSEYIDVPITQARKQYEHTPQATASNRTSVLENLWSPLLPLVENKTLKIRSVPAFRNAQLILREEHHLATAPRSRTVSSFWIHGPAGTGKSIRAIAALPDAYTKPPQDIYFNGYFRHSAVVLHELSSAQLGKDARPNLTQFLKNWSDVGNQHRLLSVKGGYTPAFYHLFVVTSNFSLAEIFGAAEGADLLALSRRFHQIHIGPDDREASLHIHPVTGVSLFLPSFDDALSTLI